MQFETSTGDNLTEHLAPHDSETHRQMLVAVAANDASLLVQEALLCIETPVQS